jgi:hypothetical protein
MAKLQRNSEKRYKSPKPFKPKQGRLQPGRVQTQALEEVVAGENAAAQASRLNDSRLPNAQRQALATQIGQAHGNQHLQRVVGLLQRAKEEVKEEDEETIQRKTDKDTDGSQYLEITIPDGKYALEAANIPATVDWSVEYGSKFTAYGTASQYTPRHIDGLSAAPHEVRNTNSGVNHKEFRVGPGKDLEPAPGEGSAKFQGFRHNRVLSDERVMEAYLRFDTVPLLEKAGETEYIGKAYDMDPLHHDYITVAEGTKIGKEETRSLTVTDGFAFSTSREVSMTVGAEITSQLGLEISIPKVAKLTGSDSSKTSLQATVKKTVGTQVTNQIQKSRQIKTSQQFDKPGEYAIVPTCKVWRTPVIINTCDADGKVTGQERGFIYTILYNSTASTVPAPGGKIDLNALQTMGQSGAPGAGE